MTIIEDVTAAAAVFPRVVLTIGSFDGVHKGHRVIIERVISLARECGGVAALMTMSPHPREFFAPDKAPNLLTSLPKKIQLFEQAGIDVVYILRFTQDIANLDRRDFVQQIIRDRCRAEMLVVGHDFCFGRNAQGDYSYLLEAALQFEFAVEQVPALFLDAERVSSTLIRERILQGDLDKAERLLGRKYSIAGDVVAGRGIGRKLGFPTANIRPHHSAVPAQGVYVAEAIVNKKRYAAAVNIGVAPTIRHEDITIEAFLLDFDDEVLGKDIEVIFHKRLRTEKKFSSHEALAAQIACDVAEVKAHLH